MLQKISFKILFFSGIFLLVDLLTKWLAEKYFVVPVVITDWAVFHFVKNTGIAWSIPLPYYFLIVLNILLLAFIPYYAFQHLDLKKSTAQIILIFIIAGACGNIFDRLVFGYVRDFIALGSWPIFNIADILLTTGVFLTLLFYGKIKRI